MKLIDQQAHILTISRLNVVLKKISVITRYESQGWAHLLMSGVSVSNVGCCKVFFNCDLIVVIWKCRDIPGHYWAFPGKKVTINQQKHYRNLHLISWWKSFSFPFNYWKGVINEKGNFFVIYNQSVMLFVITQGWKHFSYSSFSLFLIVTIKKVIREVNQKTLMKVTL